MPALEGDSAAARSAGRTVPLTRFFIDHYNRKFKRNMMPLPVAAQEGPEIPTDGLSLEDNERSLLAKALEETNGNQTQAARLLRVMRDTLRYKIRSSICGRFPASG